MKAYLVETSGVQNMMRTWFMNITSENMSTSYLAILGFIYIYIYGNLLFF